MEYPRLINDPRLTPTMERIRSGCTQLFREKKKADRSFTSHENADVVLEPPECHIFAELINGEWYWVNGCDECCGRPGTWLTYIKCTKHDVCCHCGKTRAEAKLNKETQYGHPKGWECKTCCDRIHEEEKSAALAAMGEYDEWNFWHKSDVTCPYCKYEFNDNHEFYDCDEDDPEIFKCPRCDNDFELTVVHLTKFTTKRIEK
jgi:hypothetical protein